MFGGREANPIGYSSFKESPKALITSDQIGKGQVQLVHLDPALFAEIRGIALHSHTGTKSRRVNLRNLEGSFGPEGFFIYSSDATKRYRVTVDSGTNAFVLTEG